MNPDIPLDVTSAPPEVSWDDVYREAVWSLVESRPDRHEGSAEAAALLYVRLEREMGHAPILSLGLILDSARRERARPKEQPEPFAPETPRKRWWWPWAQN